MKTDMEVEKLHGGLGAGVAVATGDDDYHGSGNHVEQRRPESFRGTVNMLVSRRTVTAMVCCLIMFPVAVAIYNGGVWNPLMDGISRFSFSGKASCEALLTPSGVSNDTFQSKKENFLGDLILPGNASSTHSISNSSKREDISSSRQASATLSGNSSNTVVIDRTLDGLLALNTDESACLSRHNIALYRKPSPYKPSTYLIEKLRKYENLHRKCGPYSKQYKRSTNQLKSGIRKSSRRGTSSECKYIVWVFNSGLGNRMVSLASTFLYALLSNRVLLIDKSEDMDLLFCEPFPGSTWFLPPGFPISYLGFNQKHPRSFGYMVKYHKTGEPMQPYVNMYLIHNYDEFDSNFFCDEGQVFLQKVPWMVLLSNLYFLPSFFQMPGFQDELNQMFPDKETVFHHLGRYLFHPANDVWGLTTRFYDGYLASAGKRLGIQVRVFNQRTKPYVTSHIVRCAVNEKLLPETNPQEHLTRNRNRTRSKAVLMTSLHALFYENIKDLYWEHSNSDSETITVYQPSHEESEKRGNKMQEKKALAEMFLLSMTDELITSEMSTFGYVAQGLGGLKPWLLRVHLTDNPVKPCYRDLSMEPCNLMASYFNCRRKKIDTNITLPPYLAICRDRRNGYKLINNVT